jgi:hypothetical protein
MKEIATSLADFEEIVTGDYIYVDKTEFLYNIVRKDKYYFLSRPRRFGKTLFVDTLHTFFEGKKELFADLYVYNQEWDWEEYPIIKLDFNKLPSENRQVLEKGIKEQLLKIANKYSVNLKEEEAYFMFSNLIEKLSAKYNKGVVVLVDEYDKPIINNIGSNEDLKIAKENQKFMKIFYDNLKALEPQLRLVFITGVSKFSKVSIFSTLNNLIELDMHPRFSAMLGYTDEELRNNFKEHFKVFADKLGLTVEKLLDKFKLMYNGFRFSDEEIKVYNPYSIAKALDYQKLDNYWFESGTPTFLVDLIQEKDFDITKIDNLEVGRNKLKAYDITKLNLIPLLFQTGYLTIKEIEDNIIYKLGYPNYEVEKGLSENLLASITEDNVETPVIHRIKKSLMDKNYNKFIEHMKSLFANIPNLIIPSDVQQREDYYHTIFYLTGVLLTDNNLGVYSELLTSEGRIDLVVEMEDYVFIIEFKCDQIAEKAVEQIEEKNYSKRFELAEKELVLIGINFSTEKKNVDGVKIVEN